MKYTDYDKFSERIGILTRDQLISLGWDADNGNRICYSRLAELLNFVEKLNSNSINFIKGDTGKRYHIATDLDTGGLEDTYFQKHNLDYSYDVPVAADYIVNRIAYLNRIDYFLCDGDDNESLYLESIEEV